MDKGRSSGGGVAWLMGFCINRIKFVDIRVCTKSQRSVNGLDNGRSKDWIGSIQTTDERDVRWGFTADEEGTC